MSIRYDDKLKQKVTKTVKNFNAKVRYNKTKTRGKGMLPSTISAKALMDKYSDKSRNELEKQLKLYQSFGNRQAIQKATDSSRLSKWEANYFKANYEKTISFYDQEIAELEHIIGDKPEYYLKQHNRLQTLQDRRKFLNKDFERLSEDDIKIMRSTYNYAERSELVKRQGFRLYLSQLERVLKLQKVPKTEREELLNKFNVLSENEFTEMVRNENAIDAVYTMVYSPKGRGKYELVSDDKHTKEAITKLRSVADELIKKYKQND